MSRPNRKSDGAPAYRRRLRLLAGFAVIAQCLFPLRADESRTRDSRQQPIPIGTLKRSSPIDFNKEILPILKNNCLACHNRTTPKAKLVLETPADILRGGESGPAIEPRKGGSSLLLKAASHQLEDTIMPPPGNKVHASNLTPEQLALVQLWIDQGAIPSTPTSRQLEWQPLPEGLNPIYAVALTSDGQFAACGRANQIFIYHLPTGRLVTRLVDPGLVNSRARSGVAHRDLVQSLAFDPGGTLLASGGFREVKLWRRPHDPRIFRIASAGHGSVAAIAVSPDGKWLATGGIDGRIRFWNRATGKLATALARQEGSINSVSFSADSTLLCSGSTDKSLSVWKVADGQLLARAETPAGITAVRWLTGGNQIAAAATDSLIRIFDFVLNPGRLQMIRELRGHGGAVTALETVSSLTGQILSGGDDGTVRLWNVLDGRQLFELKHGAPVTAVAVRPDGKRFASAGSDATSRLWDAVDGKFLAELKGEQRAQTDAEESERVAVFSKSELEFHQNALKSAETNQTTQVARVKKATEADETAANGLLEKQKHLAEAKDAKTAAEKSVEDLKTESKKASESLDLAGNAVKEAESNAASTKSHTAIEAKAAAGKLLTELKEKERQAAEKLKSASKTFTDAEGDLKKATQNRSNTETELQLSEKALSDAEKKIVEATTALKRAGDARTDAELAAKYARIRVGEYRLPIRAAAFSPDNLTLATAGDDGLVHTWSAETGTPFDTFRGHIGSVLTVIFAPNGDLVSAGADRSVEGWDLNAPWALARVIGTGGANSLLADRVNALRFSPDGRRLATGGGEPIRSGEIMIWDVSTGKQFQSYTNVHSDAVFALDFTRDGNYLATASADRFARVIDLNTGKVVKQFEGHTHHVLGIGWKRDGRTLATAGADNLVKVWDFLSGDRKKNIAGFDKEVTSIGFVGYTDQALATSGDGRVRLIREDGSDIRSFSGASDFIYSAAASADGRIVIAGGQDGVLRVWNGTDGQLIVSFPPPEGK